MGVGLLAGLTSGRDVGALLVIGAPALASCGFDYETDQILNKEAKRRLH